MIFVCVGSREYQFNRLLKEVDKIIENGEIEDKVFAQIGQSNYVPKNYEYKSFLDSEEFRNYQKNADIIISHGGTGALVNALKLKKKVISVPRLSEYGEHIDDHQLQVTDVLEKKKYLYKVIEISELSEKINDIKNDSSLKTFNSNSRVLNLIDEFLESEFL